MYRIAILAALATVSTAAQAQEIAKTWQVGDTAEEGAAFRAPLAYVQAADGSTLLLKCDKPGNGEVYATIMSTEKLGNPARDTEQRGITYRFDTSTPRDASWRYTDTFAVALGNMRGILSSFVQGLANAKQLEVKLEKKGSSKTVDLLFDVTGADQAIAKVYEGCNDKNPAA